MVSWNSIQLGRARAYLRSLHPGQMGIRYLSYTVTGCSVIVLLTGVLLPIPNYVTALVLLFLSPGIILGSYSLFLRYLWYHPQYLLPKARASIFDEYDLETLVFILRWREKGYNVADITNCLESSPLALELWYRLNLQQVEVDNLNDEKILDLLDQSRSRPDIYGLLFEVAKTPPFQEQITESNIPTGSFDLIFKYYRQKALVRKELALFWVDPKYHHQGGFANDWSMSYTNILDSLSSEITGYVHRYNTSQPLYSRSDLVGQVIQELEKARGQNVILVGPNGSGRNELFYHVAGALLSSTSDSPLSGVGIRVLRPEQIIQRSADKNQLVSLTNQLFSEISRAKRVVVFIPDLDMLLSPSEKIGTIDLGALLSSNLTSKDVHIIASLDSQAYISLVKSYPSLSQSFSVVKLREPSYEDLVQIVLDHVLGVESRYRVVFSYQAILEVVDKSKYYLKDLASPDRELSLLEDIASFADSTKRKFIGKKEVLEVLSRQSGVEIEVDNKEKATLLNLVASLNNNIIGQPEATKTIAEAILRSRAGLKEENKPVASFLLLGPTGVGKTETGKVLARSYYGSSAQLIHLDMTEYGDERGLEKLLGRDPVNNPGTLTVKIQERPNGVVLFDEIEKAHPYVKNALFQVLDEGRLTTNFGKVLDFSHSIILATSNAGSDLIRQNIEAGKTLKSFEKALMDHLFSKGIFSPEFINRFEGVVVYSPLTKENVLDIVRLRLSELSTKLKAEKGINIRFDESVISALATRGYDPVFGARALERTIKNELETTIAKTIIEKNPSPGTEVVIEDL